jgi:hypothetical protein
VRKALEAAVALAEKDAARAAAESSEQEPFIVNDSWGAKRADALHAIASAFLARQTDDACAVADRYQVVVHIDHASSPSTEGVPHRCELEGEEEGSERALAAETARRLACDGSVVGIVENDDGEPLNVGRKTRSTPPALQRALKARDGGWRFPGCDRTRFTAAHHVHHWRAAGRRCSATSRRCAPFTIGSCTRAVSGSRCRLPAPPRSSPRLGSRPRRRVTSAAAFKPGSGTPATLRPFISDREQLMGYFTGITLALAVAAFARWSGFDRERAFYPSVVVVVASYYVLFAAMDGSVHTLVVEAVAMAVFTVAAVLGFKRYPWLVVAGLVGHGAFDLVHDLVITNPGVPEWWPAFCLTFDLGAGALLAARALGFGAGVVTMAGEQRSVSSRGGVR